MQKKLHPTYHKVIFYDTTSKTKFLTRSTMSSKEMGKWEDGKEYPVIKTEISNVSHPFYTGKRTFAGLRGRVDKFNKRYNKK